jgi:hypothetical protein
MTIVKTWDTEASSLDTSKSWPIEIGWVDINLETGHFENEKSFLLKPNKNWTDWNPESEKIHNISKETLVKEGVSAIKAYNTIKENYKGEHILVDSNYDVFWFKQLEKQAIKEGLKKTIDIKFFDFETYLMQIIYSHKNTVFPHIYDISDKAYKIQPHIHRALQDAQNMAWKIKLALLNEY